MKAIAIDISPRYEHLLPYLIIKIYQYVLIPYLRQALRVYPLSCRCSSWTLQSLSSLFAYISKFNNSKSYFSTPSKRITGWQLVFLIPFLYKMYSNRYLLTQLYQSYIRTDCRLIVEHRMLSTWSAHSMRKYVNRYSQFVPGTIIGFSVQS